jgi:hypothetical protein
MLMMWLECPARTELQLLDMRDRFFNSDRRVVAILLPGASGGVEHGQKLGCKADSYGVTAAAFIDSVVM